MTGAQDELKKKIDATGKMTDRPYSRNEVVEIIRSVLSTMETSDAPMAKLYDELDSLAKQIEAMRQDLSHMRSDDINSKDIPAATDELDAVVLETKKATDQILGACEKIEKLAESSEGELQNTLVDCVTHIYEACGFQDITGQRINKVVKTLKSIESKVGEILKTLGAAVGESVGGTGHHAPPAPQKDDKTLLNGPQLAGKASSQDDIDALLASFDK